MIKTASKLADGRILVVLGLSDANVKRLKQDMPIAFDMSSLGFPPMGISIAYRREDGMAGFPNGFVGIALAFSDAALEAMQKRPNISDTPAYRFTVFRGTDEQTMANDLRGLIGPETIVQHHGYAPSQIPPLEN